MHVFVVQSIATDRWLASPCKGYERTSPSCFLATDPCQLARDREAPHGRPDPFGQLWRCRSPTLASGLPHHPNRQRTTILAVTISVLSLASLIHVDIAREYATLKYLLPLCQESPGVHWRSIECAFAMQTSCSRYRIISCAFGPRVSFGKKSVCQSLDREPSRCLSKSRLG